MTIICRMNDADNLAGQFQSRKPGAFVRGTILTVVCALAAFIAWAFSLMGDSPLAKIIAAALGVLTVYSVVRIYLKQKEADRYFTAYVMSDDVNAAVVAADLTRACTNDVLFGAQYSVTFGRESNNWGKVMRNMRTMNTSSKVEEFLCRRDVLTYCGSVVESVESVSEMPKEYRVRARLRHLDTKHFLIPRYSSTLHIPKDFTNADELADRLRCL